MDGKVELSIDRYEALRSIERNYNEAVSAIRKEKDEELAALRTRVNGYIADHKVAIWYNKFGEWPDTQYQYDKIVCTDDAVKIAAEEIEKGFNERIAAASFIKRLKYLFTKELS